MSSCRNFLIVLLIFASLCSYAQGDYASIKKNVNARAQALFHDLNPGKDTLILRSTKKMFRVYTVGHFSGVIDQYLNTYEYTVPLRGLKQGKYVFVVDQSKKKIVFQVLIHDPFHIDSETMVTQKSDKFVPKIDIDAAGTLADLANEILKISADNLDVYLKNKLRLAQIEFEQEERERIMREEEERERLARLKLTQQAEEEAKSASLSMDGEMRSKRIVTKRPEQTGGFSLSYQLNKRDREKTVAKKSPSKPKEPINKLTIFYGYKPYNISDQQREGVQSRAEKRIEMGLDKKKTEQKVADNKGE